MWRTPIAIRCGHQREKRTGWESRRWADMCFHLFGIVGYFQKSELKLKGDVM